jgi:PBP1b-binding outer membrane lipoprotein LpoB
MKHIFYALILVGMVALASCSSYTCPTYSKVPAAKKESQVKI